MVSPEKRRLLVLVAVVYAMVFFEVLKPLAEQHGIGTVPIIVAGAVIIIGIAVVWVRKVGI